MRRMQWLGVVGVIGLLAVGCAANEDRAATGDEQDVASDATLKLTADYRVALSGKATAGHGLRVEYALERLPQCRGDQGGQPGWTITGFYSQNGAPASTFEVSEVVNGARVAKAARIPLVEGGDVAVWFQVTSRFGCSEYDSQYGQNFHVAVGGPAPDTDASLVFGADGSVKQSGDLHAGGKVKVHYEQSRLDECEQTQGGNPVWTITGFAQLDGETPHMFDTARPDGPERSPIDAVVSLPHAGKLALWFQSTSISGCMEYDSKNGANYTFQVGD